MARVWAAREAGTLTEVEVGGEARAEAAMVVAAKELGEAATEVMVAAVAAVEVARVGVLWTGGTALLGFSCIFFFRQQGITWSIICRAHHPAL